MARLLDVTDHPKVEKWVQFPKVLFLLLLVPGDTESGAFYLYHRHGRVGYWIDFDDEKFTMRVWRPSFWVGFWSVDALSTSMDPPGGRGI